MEKSVIVYQRIDSPYVKHLTLQFALYVCAWIAFKYNILSMAMMGMAGV